MTRKEKINIKKIAELAGVSVATVSRVFNHPEKVLPETREHVLNITDKYDFTPSWIARGLAKGTTKTIALLIPAIVSDLNQNIISGVEVVAGNKGYAVIFGQTHGEWERESNFLKLMKDRKVDGIILVGTILSSDSQVETVSMGIPCVHIGQKKNCDCTIHCYFDFVDAAHRLLSHLTELGHQSISLVYDKKQSDIWEAFQTALPLVKSKFDKEISMSFYEFEASTQGGYLAVQRIIKQNILPDALITGNDLQAIGALKAARDANLKVPEDLALASFNDSPVCSCVYPALTSVEMPAARLGMTAARMLFDCIENNEPDLDFSQELILKPRLKVRESCGNKTAIFELFD